MGTSPSARLTAVAACIIATATVAGAQPAQRISVPVRLSPEAVSEAPQGTSDGNWVVGNIVDGRWGTAPYYPNQQWMARHISEPGYDIWCRLDLGRPRRIHRVDLGNSLLPSFVHVKDIRLEFSDGSTVDARLERNSARQTFTFAPVTAEWCRIHLLSHYGDGTSIDTDSGGLAEVVLYELVEPAQASLSEVAFVPGDGGEVTAGLVTEAPVDGTDEVRPAEGQFLGDAGQTWRLWYDIPAERRAPRTGWAFFEVECGPGDAPTLEVADARLFVDGSASDSGRVLGEGRHRVLCEVTGPTFSIRLVRPGGARVTLTLQDTGGRAGDILRDLLALTIRPRIVRPSHAPQVRLVPPHLAAPAAPGGIEAALLASNADTVGLDGPEVASLRLDYRTPARVSTTGLRPGVYTVRLRDRPTVQECFTIAEPGAPEPGTTDLSGDGRPDLLVLTWNGRLSAFIADDGPLPWTDLDRDWNAYFNRAFAVGDTPPRVWTPERARWGSYTLLVDQDGDRAFDHDVDFWYQVIDVDGDGDPDIEFYAAELGTENLIKYCFDLDDDNRQSYIDWAGACYGNEQAYEGSGQYLQDTLGNGFFANGRTRMGDRYFTDLRGAWENPIAWYDLDDDGATELVVRATDGYAPSDGRLMEFEVAFDIDRSTTPRDPSSLDLQVTRLGYQSRPFDYSAYVEDFPRLAGLPQADYLFGRRRYLRHQTQRMWIPYLDAYQIGMGPDIRWDSAFLLFDEDDDDNRWEEMFSPHEGYGYEDHLGDRWESDDDYNGGGQLYVGKFDGRIHLYGANRAEWTVDPRALFKGSIDRGATSEGPLPPNGLRYACVRYTDTDGNGFIDHLTYGEARYGAPDSFEVTREVDLLAFADEADPHPDVCELFDLSTAEPATGRKVSDWDGRAVTGLRLDAYDRLCALFRRAARARFQAAAELRDAARAQGLLSREAFPSLPAPVRQVSRLDKAALAGLTDVRPRAGYHDLQTPRTLHETYSDAYWLAEKVFADLLAAVPPERRHALSALYYEGRLDELADVVAHIQ